MNPPVLPDGNGPNYQVITRAFGNAELWLADFGCDAQSNNVLNRTMGELGVQAPSATLGISVRGSNASTSTP
jgi:hypothetical protein